jgi:hypothetical protein
MTHVQRQVKSTTPVRLLVSSSTRVGMAAVSAVAALLARMRARQSIAALTDDQLRYRPRTVTRADNGCQSRPRHKFDVNEVRCAIKRGR